MAYFIDSVISSAYIITRPSTFLAALPMVCISDVSLLKNPALSASSMATSETSGKSRPSLKRLIPTSTSNSPVRRSFIISILSIDLISECKYLTLIPAFDRYSVRLSAIFLVNVVTKTRWPFSVTEFISPIKSSI